MRCVYGVNVDSVCCCGDVVRVVGDDVSVAVRDMVDIGVRRSEGVDIAVCVCVDGGGIAGVAGIGDGVVDVAMGSVGAGGVV